MRSRPAGRPETASPPWLPVGAVRSHANSLALGAGRGAAAHGQSRPPAIHTHVEVSQARCAVSSRLVDAERNMHPRNTLDSRVPRDNNSKAQLFLACSLRMHRVDLPSCSLTARRRLGARMPEVVVDVSVGCTAFSAAGRSNVRGHSASPARATTLASDVL